jgi:hypothetical protein
MMKKYFLMMVMLFTMSMGLFAEDNNANEVQRTEMYNVKVSIKNLSRFLELSKDQIESVSAIEEEFSRDLMFAAVECNDKNRLAVTQNAIDKNIKHMAYILNKKQYQKYLKVLNVTINNRGLLH